MIVGYQDADFIAIKDKLYYLIATKTNQFASNQCKSIINNLESQPLENNFSFRKIKFYSTKSLIKSPKSILVFFKDRKKVTISSPNPNNNYQKLSELIVLGNTFNRLNTSVNWTPIDRQLAGNFFELKQLCEDYDLRMQAKKEIEEIFALYQEPDESKSSEENVAASKKYHYKLQSAFEKLDEELYHSKQFNAELLEKLRFGAHYGILVLCPQLFDKLVNNEEDREKFNCCLLNPEIHHDSEQHTIFRKQNYIEYLRIHSDITANAQEKGPLCKLLMNAILDLPNQMKIFDHLTTFRVSETDIGPRPNDRYKYLDYFSDELLEDIEFLTYLVIKDHEVYHHLPKYCQRPIKKDINRIFHQSKDKEFFFRIFGYVTDEAKDQFIVQYIAKTPKMSYLSTLPENLLTVERLLKSIQSVKERKLHHGEELAELKTIYTLAIDKVNNSKWTVSKKNAEMQKIRLHMQKNNFPDFGSLTCELIPNQNEFLA